jgi:asparagine synthase (glutamine-hydrolysing)
MSLPMFDKIKQDGKRVVISGQGGDHLFTGTSYVLYDLLRRFRFVDLLHELRHYSKPWGAVKSSILKPLLGSKGTALVNRILHKNTVDPFSTADRGIRDFSQIVGIKNPAIRDELDMVTSLIFVTIMDGSFFHAAELYYDIEYRHPYFDLALVEFVLSLPAEMKRRGKIIKWILREAMKDILPVKIRMREDKADFRDVLIQQIKTIDFPSLLDNPFIVRLGLMDREKINQYRKAFENNELRYLTLFWVIINVEYWYRYNFAQDSLLD